MIKASQLTLQLSGHKILDGIDIMIEPNEWVYLLGPSGSGKTTLLRAVAGLIPSSPGAVQLAPATIAYLPQEPSLWPHLNAWANVALGLDRGGPRGKTKRRDAAGSWLNAVDAPHLANKFPEQLSGGEARRVELARALASGASLFLLDEPTSHLDLHHSAEIHRLLRKLHTEHRFTTLCVMHQIEPPMRRSDRAILIDAGRIHSDGPLNSLPRDTDNPFIEAVQSAALHLEP